MLNWAKRRLCMPILAVVVLVLVVQSIFLFIMFGESSVDRMNIQGAMTGFLSNLHWSEVAMKRYGYANGKATMMDSTYIKSTLAEAAGTLSGLYPYLYMKYGNTDISYLAFLFTDASNMIPPNPRQLSAKNLNEIDTWLAFCYNIIMSTHRSDLAQGLVSNIGVIIRRAPKVLTSPIG